MHQIPNVRSRLLVELPKQHASITPQFHQVLRPFAGVLSVAAACANLLAQAPVPYTAKDRQPTPAELSHIPPVATPEKAAALQKEVSFPDGFDVSIFATPPAVNYPVFVAAATDGTVYVSSDGNGSLDRKPHLGRVLRVRDTNNDGQADEVKAFVPDIDSPRGLVWDHDRLYLLHPPHISAFIDKDGDGVADEQKILVKNVAFTFKDRPADHSSNGLELGIDGWLYAAIGDFGFMEAEGTDGRKLQLRGGGVIRVRPDGTGLELYARGTRNILEAAVSPLLDLFARDNTNDGGGWDVRFHHIAPLGEHGYPSLYKNFTQEIVAPLADYGGGSGCGAAWIDEPGIPAPWNNAPFTADWGRERVFHHGLTASGATFTATQEEFCKLPRVTDLDVDGSSRIYAASWKGASFTWVGPDVGFLVRATPKGYTPPPLLDYNKASDTDLIQGLSDASHRRRLEAQRTLLRRPFTTATTRALVNVASDSSKPTATRVAAVFALKQGLGPKSVDALAKLTQDSTIAPWALRALTDRWDQLANVSESTLLKGLKSPDARTRRETAVALARLGKAKASNGLTALLDDREPVIVHTVVQGLIRNKAHEACFAVVDRKDASAQARVGALRALQLMHDPAVSSGLIDRLANETYENRREGLITALCRLHSIDGTWKGDSWGTRPDTRGPYYQPEAWSETPRILQTLKTALDKATPKEAALIGREMSRHRIPAGEAIEHLIRRAASEPSLLPAIAIQLAESETIPLSAIPLLIQVARADDSSDATRAQAAIALAKCDDAEAWKALLRALPRIQATKSENNLAEKARNAVFNSARIETQHTTLEGEAERLEGEASTLADVLLLKLAAKKVGSPEARASANNAIISGWRDAKRKIQIMKAAGTANDSTHAAWFVAALSDGDTEVAQQAAQTVKRLKIDPAKMEADAKIQHVGDLPISTAIAGVIKLRGDVATGEQLFTKVGCVGCHTTRADEPLKGPYLGTIAATYKRNELAEAILLPNKSLAQGFVANHFELKDGSEVDGFVVQEAADAVTIRTVAAQEQKIPTNQIVRREKLEKSLMPDGLVAALSLSEFASLLDFLQSLSDQKK